MVIFTIKINGSGDYPTINDALVAIRDGVDSTFYAPNESFQIILADAGAYDVAALNLTFATASLDIEIEITASLTIWQQPIIHPTGSSWLSPDLPPGRCKITLSGLTLQSGIIILATISDVTISGCITSGIGSFVSYDGQLVIEETIGDPFNVLINGDVDTAANSEDGLSTTMDRPGLIVRASRLGLVQTTKPAQITNCDEFNCGIDSYAEIGSPSGTIRAVNTIIGSLLDKVNFLGEDGLIIRRGGLYRSLGMKALFSPVPTYQILVDGATHPVTIENCDIENADYGIHLQGIFGEINIVDNIFLGISYDRVLNDGTEGTVMMLRNRGPGGTLLETKDGCP